MVQLDLEEQLPPGTLEHALHHLIEKRVPDEWFDALYANDELGRPAYSPRLLLKVILLGYARGIIGSRRLERACRENMTFLALACGIRPDHSTLAAFVLKLENRIELIFSEVLTGLPRRRTPQRHPSLARRSEAPRERFARRERDL